MAKKSLNSYELSECFRCEACRAKGYTCLPQKRQWPGERCTRCVKGGRKCGPGITSRRAGRQQFTTVDDERTMSGPFTQEAGGAVSAPPAYYSSTNVAHPINGSQITTDLSYNVYPVQGHTAGPVVDYHPHGYITHNKSWRNPSEVDNIDYATSAEMEDEEAENMRVLQSPASGVMRVWQETQSCYRVNRIPGSNSYIMPGLTHRESLSNDLQMIWRLDNRVVRLWGCYEAFVNAGGVSDVFSRTVSRFFDTDSRLYAQQYPMVNEAYLACGAADALMNRRLPEHIRNVFKEEYRKHHACAQLLINKALEEFRMAFADERPCDILPVYYAVFLFHAAAVCAKGLRGVFYLNMAEQAFRILDQYTTEFPLRIRRCEQRDHPDDVWRVKMLLTHDEEDLGMEIGPFFFILTPARWKYDGTE